MALNSEVQMATSISRRQSGGRNGLSENFTSGQRRTSQNLTKKVFHHLKKPLDSRESLFYWTLTVLGMISTCSDSFFLYSFKVNDLKNSLELESHAAIIATVCRTVFDLLIIFPCMHERGKEGDTVIQRQKRLYFWVDAILSNLPLPQLVVSIMIAGMTSWTPLHALRILKYVIISQYPPRFLRIYRFYRQAETSESIVTPHLWVHASCCFLIYPLDGHVLGALCYLLAVERLTQCWRIAGTTIICTMNATTFDFGMFQEVILSGVLEKNLMTKFMFCFNWGLQTIRSLGGNFNTSTDVWENLFVVFINLFCMVFITLLVLGKLQHLLLSKYRKLADKNLRVQELVRSKTFKMLSTNRQEQIKSQLQYGWQETGAVEGQRLLDILPSGLQEDVLRELCLEKIKKVHVFKRLDEQILKEMCGHLKSVFYAEGYCIARKDERIKAMLFIIHGTVQSTMTEKDSSPVAQEYSDGEYWGEEIAISCLHPYLNWEPISNGNVRAATNVQAFALELGDLKKALEKHR
ncbi:cyclic nucleotide-gated ion channel 1-like [Mangifera indica]|uniref:cyclic nucleotide-gated ion channel 1-like n=1 Tax=Mangifera indica TaxID=29780 RepID=UPI001CFB0F2B|nr:cyclic nucleotide-gated ion channel 1-like [Mangifera indica]